MENGGLSPLMIGVGGKLLFTYFDKGFRHPRI
jgi:hypothetical protein